MNWKYALKRSKSRISRICLWNFICAQARSRCVRTKCTRVNKILGVDTQPRLKIFETNLHNPWFHINHLLFTFYSSIQMNSPFSCYFLDLRISFPELRSRMFYVLRKEIKMFFFKFWGESETVPEKKNRRYKNVISPVHFIWLVHL